MKHLSDFILPAGAATGRVLTSDANGKGTWQPAAGGTPNPFADWVLHPENGMSSYPFEGVCYGKGRFVVTGNAQFGISVTDGAKWASVALPGSGIWNRVAYGNGLFVVVSSASTDKIASSQDGVNWTTRYSGSYGFYAVAYGNGRFVAVGTNRAAVSLDGITWTTYVGPGVAAQRMTFGAGLFVALDPNAGDISTSPDGITWTVRATLGTSVWTDICYGNGVFLAVRGATTDGILRSTDGITWGLEDSPIADARAVAYGNGYFIALGGGGSGLGMFSKDGLTWETFSTGDTANAWNSIAYGNGVMVATSGSGYGVFVSGGVIDPQIGEPSGPTISVGATAPVSPRLNDLWLDIS